MASITARAARGERVLPRLLTGEDTASFLRDAANTPGGHTPELAIPRTEAELAALLAARDRVLVIGAQSSLTGGATPFGESLIATRAFDRLDIDAEARLATVGAGVALVTLQDALREEGLFFPPVPTYDGAFIGGAAATNAAGARTFKYGATRPWIEGLTVVLACGEVLELRRGRCVSAGEPFAIQTSAGVITVPIPTDRLPDVAKCSAGYPSGPPLDLVDLFIGAEGTLGIVTELVLKLEPLRSRTLWGFVTLATEAAALELAGRMRAASRETWQSGDALGLDIAAIESLDGLSLRLLREEGEDRKQGVELPEEHAAALLFEVELPAELDDEALTDQMADALEGGEADGPVARLVKLLVEFDAVDGLEVAMPGDRRRAEQLFALRDSVPTIVNHRIRDAQRDADGRIQKTAGDMIVPFERLGEMITALRSAFAARGLEAAIWGHISDGNLHPNVLAKSYEDVVRGKEALLEVGRRVVELGGSPLAEHGVGRNPMKLAMLELLRGADGLAGLRTVKAALDPAGKLAPGVLLAAGPEAADSTGSTD